MAVSSLSATIRPPFPSPSSSNFSAIAVKPKLSLLSLPSTASKLKALKPSRSSTVRVFAAPEVLDSLEILDGPDFYARGWRIGGFWFVAAQYWGQC